VIIQTFNPYHSVIRNVIDHDYLAMYNSQILERRNFKYPPFYRLIQLQLKHKDPRILNDAARELAIMLRQILGNRILGPEYPMVSRVRNFYLKNILIKLEKPDLKKHKTQISKTIVTFRGQAAFKSIRGAVDVDPG
jgi:primosomal protein N' (replication factor Y)